MANSIPIASAFPPDKNHRFSFLPKCFAVLICFQDIHIIIKLAALPPNNLLYIFKVFLILLIHLKLYFTCSSSSAIISSIVSIDFVNSLVAYKSYLL